MDGVEQMGMEGHGSRKIVQLAMWEMLDNKSTNMVALYDIAPKFIIGQWSNSKNKEKIICREFVFSGKKFSITIKPTTIKLDDGSIVEKYLGEREQIIEDVIRKLACKRSRLVIQKNNKVKFSFSMNEIKEELRRIKHSYNIREICEAIILLNEVRLTISDVEAGGSPLLSASVFPVMGMKNRGGYGETFVEFNPLVAEAIRLLEFTKIDYDTVISMTNPITRWLVKRLYIDVSSSLSPIQRIKASAIWRDSGMPEQARTRRALARVTSAVGCLVDTGVLDGVEIEEVFNGQRKVDVIYTLNVSPDFMARVYASNRIARENHEEFHRLVGKFDIDGGFAEVSENAIFRLREARRLELSREAEADSALDQ